MSGKGYERGKAQTTFITKERELLRCKSSGNGTMGMLPLFSLRWGIIEVFFFCTSPQKVSGYTVIYQMEGLYRL